MDYRIDEKLYLGRLSSTLKFNEAGKISQSIGLIFEAHLPGAAVGSLCKICKNSNPTLEEGIDAEVIGFRERSAILMPFEDVQGVNNDSLVVLKEKNSALDIGPEYLGRVIDANGKPIDGKGPITLKSITSKNCDLYRDPIDPMSRKLIKEPLDLGIRSINGLLSCGKGQRIGIMAGSGVGKSVLLGMIAKNTSADVNVIALIGERGREVKEFIERDLGEEGLKRSVVIVATSDASPLMRVRGAYLALTVSEYFRDEDKDFLLLMYSVTRFCMAKREIGLSLGEPPATKGYTPSVFSALPKLLERAGTSAGDGSITGLFTVLVEGDDMDEPIADSARSILDGHIVLSRKLAEKAQFPAVDILQSTSRVMPSIVDEEQVKWASAFKEWMSVYSEAEDMINIGAYVPGSNPKIDQAVAVNDRIISFLKQGLNENVDFEGSKNLLRAIYLSGQAIISSDA